MKNISIALGSFTIIVLMLLLAKQNSICSAKHVDKVVYENFVDSIKLDEQMRWDSIYSLLQDYGAAMEQFCSSNKKCYQALNALDVKSADEQLLIGYKADAKLKEIGRKIQSFQY